MSIYGFDLEATKYFLLPWDMILAIVGEAATVSNWNGNDNVPLYDRLYLGGANNLRGFDFREVGPKDDHGDPSAARASGARHCGIDLPHRG